MSREDENKAVVGFYLNSDWAALPHCLFMPET